MRCTDVNEGITTEILQRLPVKSLVRFKCVCKGWGFRFQNPDFVEAHHRTQRAIHNGNGNGKFLVRRGRLFCTRFFVVIDFSIDEEDNVSVKENEKIYFPFFAEEGRVLTHFFSEESVIVFGPCNGIVCLDTRDGAVLWNPATREVKSLQPCTLTPAIGSYARFSYILSFGYDPKTNDFKVLRTTFDEQSSYDGIAFSGVDRIELYSLNKNEWRLLPEQFIDRPLDNLYMDGVCHISDKCRVLSFNLEDETFTFTELPDCLHANVENEVVLTRVGNYLGMVRYTQRRRGQTRGTYIVGCRFLEIWVLKEIGVKDSWTKQATIGPVEDGVTRFLGFLKEMVLVEVMFEQLNAHNPKNLKLQTLPFYPIDDSNIQEVWFETSQPKDYYRPMDEMLLKDYAESLVPIHGRQEHEEGIFRSFFSI